MALRSPVDSNPRSRRCEKALQPVGVEIEADAYVLSCKQRHSRFSCVELGDPVARARWQTQSRRPCEQVFPYPRKLFAY